jgi:sigma-B regulation protein RsbU (phosphoserine phosphatase)
MTRISTNQGRITAVLYWKQNTKFMLTLRDLFHLPQVDPILQQFKEEETGLTVVAGIDPRAHVQTGAASPFPASGRAGIFRILVRELLEANASLKATIIAESRDALRVPRGMRRRVHFEVVSSEEECQAVLASIAPYQRGLLVVDRLTPQNATAVLAAAQEGSRAIAQMDTVFRGAEVARALLSWGVPRSRLNGLRWVIAMDRGTVLCDCKRPADADPELATAIQRRYPHLAVDRSRPYFQEGGCKDCEHTGRRNEITAFDFFRTDPDMGFENSSLFPLEAYLLGLAEDGYIPLSDLLRIESDQLHRTYQLLTASEAALSDAKSTLERKVVELEAANRVLRSRTEELVSLQEIGQALIGTTTLRDLARHVCRQAKALCGADRAIFYFRRDLDQVEVLATHGWEPGRIPRQAPAKEICNPDARSLPVTFVGWPPGVKAGKRGETLRAGLRIPLVAQGKPVGAMIVHSTTKSRFQPGAVALLQTFANQAAIAIQRAGLIESLREKITQLEAAQEGLAQKERMERELELAREVQQAVLPRTFPAVRGYTFAAQYRPARQVGGDFYDVIHLGPGRFGLVVADVSDKGMPAAVYMALTRSLMVAEARREASPCAVLHNVNKLLLELGQARMFVTVFYGVVEAARHRLTYTRAGHNRPLLVRGGQVQDLPGEGMLLGYLDSEQLTLGEDSLELEPGDRLVLFTDGLIDARSPQGQRLKQIGLAELLKASADLPVDGWVQAVFQALARYQGGAEQYDDMTLLAVEVLEGDSY